MLHQLSETASHLNKCKVMHTDHGLETDYYLEENGAKIELERTVEEKDH